MNSYVGIDVAQDTLDVYLLNGTPDQHYAVANQPTGFRLLHQWLKQHHASAAHICLEATGIDGLEGAQFLHDKGYKVSVVNPARSKGFATRQMRRSQTASSACRLETGNKAMPF